MATSTTSTRALTSCQTKALDVLQREGNVFLTGAAGTGKSFLLDHYLKGKPTEAFPVVASTGAAAVIVGGRTFHSFFGLGILEGGPEAAILRAMRSGKLVNRLERACCVVIDEVSMLSGTTLRAAETLARRVRGRNIPWGGLRIIAVGDFAQLPPVAPWNEGKDWAFLHPVWQESDFQPALLSTVMRTQDLEFLTILNFVRNGTMNDVVSSYLNQRTAPSSHSTESTRLYPHRAQAEEFNLKRLEAIPRPLQTFPTEYVGKNKFLEAAKKAMPIPETLLLKEGALVMMRKNDLGLRWVNGSLGTVRTIHEDGLEIDLVSGESIEIGKEKFSYLDGDGLEVLAAWNFPVTLAWATTIHKAQGASLDCMIVDLDRLWEPGQAYVALSRVRAGSGLSIERWSPTSIRAEPLVTQFYDRLSDQAQKYVPRPLFAPPASPEKEPRGLTSRERIELTQILVEDHEDLEFIAGACDVTIGTVLNYIEKLLLLGIDLDLSYLTADLPNCDRIRALFASLGLEKLSPVFQELDGAVSYETLRILRCVMMAEKMKTERTVVGEGIKENEWMCCSSDLPF
ncbi:AAA family ATPase [Candidatus Peregrinibacteria bacterium]|nr:AAA family ATPase [Candidatus Peregrinibacteria bacterium]